MQLKQLEYFECVAELGGFSKAAAALSVTQSALSKQIRQLEVEIHQNLLLRNGRGVSLTEEGAVFLAHIKGILEQIERAQQEMGDLRRSPSGKVIVGCSPTVGTAVIAKVVATFRERFPKASLEIIETKAWTIYEWLRLGRLDIGILHGQRSSPSIEITPLREAELYLVSSASKTKLEKSTKVAVRQLGKYPLILPGNQRAIRTLLEKAATKVGIKLDIPLHVEGAAYILELVHQGHGYTILPKQMVEQSNLGNKFQLNPVVNPRLTWTLTIAVSAQRRLTFLTQETVKIVKSHLLDVDEVKSLRN